MKQQPKLPFFRYIVFLHQRFLMVRVLQKGSLRRESDFGGRLSSESVAQPTITSSEQVDQPVAVAGANSPVVHGLGAFGLSSTTQALAGIYLFFYVDVLGLAVALATIIGAAIAGTGLGGTKVCREMIMANLVDKSLERTGRRQ